MPLSVICNDELTNEHFIQLIGTIDSDFGICLVSYLNRINSGIFFVDDQVLKLRALDCMVCHDLFW